MLMVLTLFYVCIYCLCPQVLSCQLVFIRDYQLHELMQNKQSTLKCSEYPKKNVWYLGAEQRIKS